MKADLVFGCLQFETESQSLSFYASLNFVEHKLSSATSYVSSSLELTSNYLDSRRCHDQAHQSLAGACTAYLHGPRARSNLPWSPWPVWPCVWGRRWAYAEKCRAPSSLMVSLWGSRGTCRRSSWSTHELEVVSLYTRVHPQPGGKGIPPPQPNVRHSGYHSLRLVRHLRYPDPTSDRKVHMTRRDTGMPLDRTPTI